MPRALSVGIVAAVLFVALAGYRLERPGLYYDELHQAPSAFAYVGRPSTLFTAMTIGGLPLLNMPYSGAIKPAVYGLYMRVTGQPFSILSWRLLGLFIGAAGIISFCAIAGSRLPLSVLALFLALLVSDSNVLFQSRHDWGPAMLAFLLRMLFLALCVRHFVSSGAASRGLVFLLGLIIGLSIFEKMSSAVLLGPLLIVLSLDARTGSIRSWIVALAGVAVGSAPIIAVNVFSWFTSGTLISLSGTSRPPGPPVLALAANYLALGNGAAHRDSIFDFSALMWPSWLDRNLASGALARVEWLEIVAVPALVILVSAVASRGVKDSGVARLALVSAASYVAIAIGLHFLPTRTGENHWIVGTPFQYLAFALLPVLSSGPSRKTAIRAVASVCFVALALSRAGAVVSMVNAIGSDRYSMAVHPSINEAARFAASQPEGTVFIAANWGVATQVLSLSNGRRGFVYEPFWDYRGEETLNEIFVPSINRALIGSLRVRNPVGAQASDRIFHDVAARAGWIEVALDPAIAALPAVELRAFERAVAPPAR